MRSVMKRRCGSTYVFVIGTAMLLTVIGLSSILFARVQARSARTINDMAEAQLYARSAIELGLFWIEQDSDWRATYGEGPWATDQAIGSGTFTLIGNDLGPQADIANAASGDSVKLTGIGMKGDARHKTEVTLEAVVAGPLPILATGAHSTGMFEIRVGKSITVVGASVSSNDKVQNTGTVNGDVDAVSLVGGGTVNGNIYVPQPVKDMPASTVFDDYVALATQLPYSGGFDKQVLAPGVNEYGGGLNADGVYFIDTPPNDLTIKASRIHGTLVIDAGTKSVTIDGTAFLHNYRQDYPVLIVKARSLYINMTSQGIDQDRYLQESGIGHNFNPSGAPYQGGTDSDQTDDFPSEIHGLVYVIDAGSGVDVDVYGTGIIRGGLIVNGGTITIHSELPTIYHDANLLTNPPPGFTFTGEMMKIAQGSWKQAVD